MEYSDEAILAMMKFHPEMKGYGWCSACKTFIDPRADGGERARCPKCHRLAFRTPEMAPPTEDPDAAPGQVVRKPIVDPEEDPGGPHDSAQWG